MTAPQQLHASWKGALKSPEIRSEGGWTGAWVDPTPSLAGLAHTIRTLEATPGRILKSSDISRVVSGELFGGPVIIKRYAPPTGWKRWIRRFRPSRARRCWATAATLRGAGIACSSCIGFLEEATGGSVVVFAEERGTISARRWIKAWLHQRPSDFRDRFRDDLAQALLELYSNGVYHADTKASNLLLLHPEDSGSRSFIWIDLECVRFGTRPSRRQVLRNLVQLNGSVGSKLSEEDRVGFLGILAQTYPWLAEPAVVEHIRTWTLERLKRELSGQCGS